jgi:hypothetical protein
LTEVKRLIWSPLCYYYMVLNLQLRRQSINARTYLKVDTKGKR